MWKSISELSKKKNQYIDKADVDGQLENSMSVHSCLAGGG